jgi:hypothetical protein
MPETIPVAAHGPYEDFAIALINLISKIVDGQPPDVRAELWRMYVEDVKAWREFWNGAKP